MEEDIKIFDNLIPEDYQNQIYNSIFENGFIKFTCNFPGWEMMGKQKLNFGLINHFKKGDYCDKQLFDFFYPLAEISCKEVNQKIKNIEIGRIWLDYPDNRKQFDYGFVHKDLPYDHTVVLYYVKDSDGDTHIFDEFGGVIKKIKPKKGRVVVFNGNLLHASGVAKEDIRAVVNIDVITEE